MQDLVQWIALLGMLGIGLLFVSEVRKWRMLGGVLTRGQRALRAAMFLTMELLFAMLLAGSWITRSKDPAVSLLYWTVCMVLGLVVIVLIGLDFRTVVRQYVRLNKQMFRDLKEPVDGDRRRMRPEDNGHET